MEKPVHVPIITIGKYAGTSMDKLPCSYLRWMLNQNFPKEWMEFAKQKVEASDHSNVTISVSRHALDMFSKRFLKMWVSMMNESNRQGDGIATYVAKLAQDAWDYGEDVSKKRHQDDGIVKRYNGIKWVFAVSEHFPEYKEVITIME